jgi:hypothetical protein
MKQYLDLVQHVMENGCQREIVQVLEQKHIRCVLTCRMVFLWLLLKKLHLKSIIYSALVPKGYQYKVFTKEWS